MNNWYLHSWNILEQKICDKNWTKYNIRHRKIVVLSLCMFGMMLNSFSIYLPKMLLFIYHIHAKQIFCQNLIYFSFDLSAARRTRRLWHTNMHTYTDEQIYANSFNSRTIDLYFIFSNILLSKNYTEMNMTWIFFFKERNG